MNLRRASQISNGSGLKVDDNRLKCLLLVEELTAFIVQCIDKALNAAGKGLELLEIGAGTVHKVIGRVNNGM